MILDAQLDFCIKNNYNVLFSGKHGVGKTTIITNAFDRAGLRWKYFSASTIDPFVDFVGVPREVKDEVTGNSYLELIRPKEFANDEIEALFFDEYNRASKKTMNAVMELIQFKSINGKKFNNLKVIWAAINPNDDALTSNDKKYNVEELDPAQTDRFQVHIDIPYKADMTYFKNKYQEKGEVAVIWWSDLCEDHKNLVSPRRLEYALDAHNKNGDIRYILDKRLNVASLITQLESGAYKKKLERLCKEKNNENTKLELKNENFYNGSIDHIRKDKRYFDYFSEFLPDEKISKLITTDTEFRKMLLDRKNPEKFRELLTDIISTNGSSPAVIKELNGWLGASDKNNVIKQINNLLYNSSTTKSEYNKASLSILTKITNREFDSDSSSDLLQSVCRFTVDFIINNNIATINSNEKDLCLIITKAEVKLSNDNQTFNSFFASIKNELLDIYEEKKVDKVDDFLNSAYKDYKIELQKPIKSTEAKISKDLSIDYEKKLDWMQQLKHMKNLGIDEGLMYEEIEKGLTKHLSQEMYKMSERLAYNPNDHTYNVTSGTSASPASPSHAPITTESLMQADSKFKSSYK